MTLYEAAAVLRKEVGFKKEDTIRKRNSKNGGTSLCEQDPGEALPKIRAIFAE